MGRKLVVGNWKMNPTTREVAAALARSIREGVGGAEGVDVGLAPPAPFLYAVGEELVGSPIVLGAQNLAWAPEGELTGEVSSAMVRDAGGAFAILGHSERRQQFGETSEQVGRRLRHTLQAGLWAIVCVGETLQQRRSGLTTTILDEQLRGALLDFEADQLGGLVVAYEPVWAIGTGERATAEQASEAHAHIRKYLEAGFGPEAAGSLRVLYGGSVKPENAADLYAAPGVDGVLVGGASLSAQSFTTLVRLAR